MPGPAMPVAGYAKPPATDRDGTIRYRIAGPSGGTQLKRRATASKPYWADPLFFDENSPTTLFATGART